MKPPLSNLASQVLVAFTIEFDNEFEYRMPHRTTRGAKDGPARGPWLVSQAMWANFMRFIGPGGVARADVEGLAQMVNLKGLERWGYITLEPSSGSGGWGGTAADQMVRPTTWGQQAQEAWRPLAGVIEERWVQRFGRQAVRDLRRALEGLSSRFENELPDYLPVIHPTTNGKTVIPDLQGRFARGGDDGADLSALLSRLLLVFTLEFESESRLSLPVSADALRVLDEVGTRERDLPSLTGISKEASAMAIGFLARRDCVVMEADPTAGRGQVVRLTTKGRKAQAKYQRILAAVEERWVERFGAGMMDDLRRSLEVLTGDPGAGPSPLLNGWATYLDGWRARVRTPATLPHHPMVLHRGGYPDGA